MVNNEKSNQISPGWANDNNSRKHNVLGMFSLFPPMLYTTKKAPKFATIRYQLQITMLNLLLNCFLLYLIRCVVNKSISHLGPFICVVGNPLRLCSLKFFCWSCLIFGVESDPSLTDPRSSAVSLIFSIFAVVMSVTKVVVINAKSSIGTSMMCRIRTNVFALSFIFGRVAVHLSITSPAIGNTLIATLEAWVVTQTNKWINCSNHSVNDRDDCVDMSCKTI